MKNPPKNHDDWFIEKDGKKYLRPGAKIPILRLKAHPLLKGTRKQGFMQISIIARIRKDGGMPDRACLLQVADNYDNKYWERRHTKISLANLKKIVELMEMWSRIQTLRSRDKDMVEILNPGLWRLCAKDETLRRMDEHGRIPEVDRGRGAEGRAESQGDQAPGKGGAQKDLKAAGIPEEPGWG